MEGEMSHLTHEALERLFSRENRDAALCLHGIRSRLIDTPAGPLAVARIVAHLVLDEVPEEDMEPGEESFLVMDIPMSPATLALVNGHFDETMSQMTESALERLITEDGET
jgi:hypothetical protein